MINCPFRPVRPVRMRDAVLHPEVITLILRYSRRCPSFTTIPAKISARVVFWTSSIVPESSQKVPATRADITPGYR